MSTAVVHAVAETHDEDVTDQQQVLSEHINADAFDGLFQQDNPTTTLQFEADLTTVTITTDDRRQPFTKIESHH